MVRTIITLAIMGCMVVGFFLKLPEYVDALESYRDHGLSQVATIEDILR